MIGYASFFDRKAEDAYDLAPYSRRLPPKALRSLISFVNGK